MDTTLDKIEEKIQKGQRLSKEDGMALYASNDLARIGQMADTVRKRISGDFVYYNVNLHVNLTNICIGQCKFCAFGCKRTSDKAYELTKQSILDRIAKAAEDPDMRNLHIVSGLHPDWPYEHYLDIIKTIKKTFPTLHLKGFTGVEIMHFVKISGKSIETVLRELIAAGLEAMPGGGAEILDDSIRQKLCPNKATSAEWLEVARTAHKLGIKTNASMLYGHIETKEQRINHLLTLRALQDETGGLQTFICFPFQPKNTALEDSITRTSVWDDLKTMAISRLMLDNVHNIKAYWVMLTLPIAMLALGFGANDIDGTVGGEKIMHAAGVHSQKSLSKNTLIAAIKETGRIPAECDCNSNVIRTF
ncbi:aminofutalosine synthase MqnE [Pectinatus cerevisiiphilus]|uniref:Aminodeoxyfutalosine synthase n=1 Tax=Pectinatus cerevisiiphilus TaxID=86956 RepID=A0A4R3KFN2_9FIRM|nr:aminofutalosine synthase MqnE [Pectinatus cerevisiiphilus]TCS82010.1 aminodeoxyfutalosine synthase [Pectinatus cerevisiiphilus]